MDALLRLARAIDALNDRLGTAANAMVLAACLVCAANAAFRYASAFGAGTARDVDRAFCERSLADWQRHVQANRLAR